MPAARIVEASEPETSGATVTVAFKHPGSLNLDLMSDEKRQTVQTNSGPQVMISRDLRQRVTVRGYQSQRRIERGNDFGRPQEHEPVASVVGGYGLTHGVPKDFWEAWLAQNAENPLVVNGLIFASGKDVQAIARERKDLVGDFDPVIPQEATINGVKIEPDFARGA